MRTRLWYTVMLVIGVLGVAATLAFACLCLSITITTPAQDGKSTFSSDPKDITCQCDTTGMCIVTWSCKDIAGVTESWPGGSTGTSVTLRLTTLPTSNSAFGEIWVMAEDTGTGKYDLNTFDLFFSEEATNNPGEVEVPNWYYYWSQTSADYGTHNYDSGYAGMGQCYFDNGAWRAYIGTEANETTTILKYSGANGIDCFAQTCRHEEQHRQDFSSLWGAGTDRNNDDDPDVDWLPTDNGTVTENSLGTSYHEGGYDPDDANSVPDHWEYGVNWRDCEDYCMHRHASWTNGSANSVDWANPGKQY